MKKSTFLSCMIIAAIISSAALGADTNDAQARLTISEEPRSTKSI